MPQTCGYSLVVAHFGKPSAHETQKTDLYNYLLNSNSDFRINDYNESA